MSAPEKSICEESQFETFFREHARQLKSYLFFKYGDEAAAEDVIQETFVKLWDNCAKVPLEKAKSYIYTVATNLSTSLKRHEQVKLRYNNSYASTASGATSESPEFLAIEQEYMDKLTEVIGSLPDRQREAFLLNRIEKKTYKEIAELMDISVKAVEKLMHKALIKIRKQLGNI